MYRKQLTAPSGAVVDLATAKPHLRVDTSDDDNLINAYISAATAYAARYTGLALQEVQYEMGVDDPGGSIILPGRPLKTVDSVIVDGAGLALGTDYNVVPDDLAPYIKPSEVLGDKWGVPDGGEDILVVRYTLGYAAGMIPKEIEQAILLIAGHWYEHRESVVTGTIATEIPQSAKALLDLRRMVPV